MLTGKKIKFIYGYTNDIYEGIILDKIITTERIDSMSSSEASSMGKNIGAYGTYTFVTNTNYLVKVDLKEEDYFTLVKNKHDDNVIYTNIIAIKPQNVIEILN